MEVVAKGRTDALQLPMTLHFIAIPVAVSVMMIHWMRRNVAGASLQTAMLKLWIAVGLFLHRLAPVGKYVHLSGWLRMPILVLALFGPMLIGVPVALSLGLMATLYVALVGNISFMTGALQVFNGVTFYALLAIPLLILSGKLMYSAGIAKLLVDFAQVLVGTNSGRTGGIERRRQLHLRRHLRFGRFRHSRHRIGDGPADETARLSRRFLRGTCREPRARSA